MRRVMRMNDELKDAIHNMSMCVSIMRRFKMDMYNGILKYPVNKTPDLLVENYESIQQYIDWMSEDLQEMEDYLKKEKEKKGE